jgi:hypothetical protein
VHPCDEWAFPFHVAGASVRIFIRSLCIVAVLELRVDCGTFIDKFLASASASERVRFVIISELNKPHTACPRERSPQVHPLEMWQTIAIVRCIKMPHP